MQGLIAVVEDDEGMNGGLRRLLCAAGYAVVTFMSAEELLASDAAVEAVCFVLDINLPGLSGFALEQRLRQQGISAPVIFITAYDEPASQAQARAVGAIAWLLKPFEGKQLLAAIQKALGLASGTAQS